MRYPVKTPWLIKKLFSSLCWNVETSEKILYLTFDDGPHPSVTSFVLDELRKYQAKATFFCIGKNVAAYPDVYKKILDEGHAVGNHTYHHLNGWKTKNKTYLEDVKKASGLIDSSLFRPPYGRIKISQFKRLSEYMNKLRIKVVMWDVLSGDFDLGISPEHCALNVLQYAKPGSIVVFHDSSKASPRIKYALPQTLKFFHEKGFRFHSLQDSVNEPATDQVNLKVLEESLK
ncbi:MAG: polysaccharide deacetylase family protein [Chitinophagaceae bacterium]|jgi:peptidoglycan/xylan/chitin deacetylase (PgdA/CDA1 family)|nr:polysaccharide deacetylase family protein [Chitinophagaceae bacterium]OQY96321.1 MAG: polysaccharide deacetylase family protein [Sphingobacteriales bacterium UTBCD1]